MIDCLCEKWYTNIVNEDKHRRKQVRKDNGKPLAEVEGKTFLKSSGSLCQLRCKEFFYVRRRRRVVTCGLKEVIHVGKC